MSEGDAIMSFGGGDLLDELEGCYKKNEKSIEERQERRLAAKAAKKPKWWYQQYAGNSRGTKAQRRARIRCAHYCVPEVQYESQFSIERLFNLPSICSGQQKDVWVELGFGQGENLKENARNHPERLFIGADVHLPGIGSILMDMEEHDDRIIKQNVKTAYKYNSNVRVSACDGVKLLRALPNNSVNCILLTFPDPMPSHKQFRIIQEETLHVFEDKLRENGKFILATDAKVFAEWTIDVFQKRHNQWEATTPPPRNEWLPVESKYERKGLSEGRSTILLCWVKLRS